MSKVASDEDNAAFGRRLMAVRATTGLSHLDLKPMDARFLDW